MKAITVNGLPQAKWQDDKVLFQWKASLPQVIHSGTNHRAAGTLRRLGINHRTKELIILDQPDEKILQKAADKNRGWLFRLEMMVALPKDKIKQELPWMESEGYLGTHEQLPSHLLWEYLLFAAGNYKKNQLPAQTILEQFSRFPNYFGLISRQVSDGLEQCFESNLEQSSWRIPRPAFNGRIVMFKGNRHTPANRLLIVPKKDWEIWELGRPNSKTPKLPVVLHSQGDEMSQLYSRIADYFPSRFLVKNNQLSIDSLGSIAVPYGVKPRETNLRGSLKVGEIIHQRAWLAPQLHVPINKSHTLAPPAWQRTADYSYPDVVAERARCKGIPESYDGFQMLDAVGQDSIRTSSQSQAVWSREVESDCMVDLEADQRMDALEAAICQSMGSGLLRPDLPFQTSRLSGKLKPLLLYTPLNPFQSSTINNK